MTQELRRQERLGQLWAHFHVLRVDARWVHFLYRVLVGSWSRTRQTRSRLVRNDLEAVRRRLLECKNRASLAVIQYAVVKYRLQASE